MLLLVVWRFDLIWILFCLRRSWLQIHVTFRCFRSGGIASKLISMMYRLLHFCRGIDRTTVFVSKLLTMSSRRRKLSLCRLHVRRWSMQCLRRWKFAWRGFVKCFRLLFQMRTEANLLAWLWILEVGLLKGWVHSSLPRWSICLEWTGILV